MAGKSVLIVDDDPALVTSVSTALELEGYAVVSAGNGQEALEVVSQSDPDIILLDVRMPVMDGWEFLQRLRSGEKGADIPVIMLTGLDSAEDVTKGWSYGVDCYLTKPFDVRELLDFVKRIEAVSAEERIVESFEESEDGA